MNVTVYSTPTCPYCKLVKKFLAKHKVSFVDIDVSVDAKAAQAMIKKTNQLGVPVVDIDGKTIVGFDEEKLKKALGI